MATFCTNCGAPLSDAVMFCTACGAKRAVPQQQQPPAQAPKAEQPPNARPKVKLKSPLVIGTAITLVVAIVAGVALSANKGGPSPRPEDNTAVVVNLGNLQTPKAGEVLSIAKKYYDHHSKAMQSSLTGELSGKVGAVNFDGKLNDAAKAEALCSDAAVVAMLEGDGDFAIASAAAAVGWSPGYARSAGTLAAILEGAGFVTDKDKDADAIKLAAYAISLDKSNPDFYITLAQLRFSQNDFNGALAAVGAALAVDPGNSAALMLQIEILARMGGGGGSGGEIIVEPPEEIVKRLKENEGELKKRDRKQQDVTKPMEPPDDDDSKEVALKKLEDCYTLEPITPADMMECMLPEQSKQLREKIMTVTDAQKELHFIEFPLKLFNDVEALETEPGKKYDQFLTEYLHAFEARARAIEESYLRPDYGLDYGDISRTPDWYMREYNAQVVHAAIENFTNYCVALNKEFDEAVRVQKDKFEPKAHEAYSVREATIAAGGDIDAAYQQEKLTDNAAYVEGMKLLVSPLYNMHTLIQKEAQRLWEKMLPYARCTKDPGGTVHGLYWNVMYQSTRAANEVTMCHLGFTYGWNEGPPEDYDGFGGAHYTTGLTEADFAQQLQEQRALEEWIAKIRGQGAEIQSWPLEEFTFSVQVGDLEFKLGTTKVEVEYANGFAGKVGFDWKKKEVSFGVGVAVKAAIGFSNNGAQLVGAEAKFYGNLVIDLKKNQVTEVSVSAEVKFNVLETAETGGQIKYTFYGDGKGWSASAQAKAKLGWAALELDQELF